ncbi:hypothetical protein EBR66_06455 [bacterium]|nr:hypothetical protein [bacterium]
MATESQQITQMIASRYGTANYGNLQVLKWQYYDYVRMTPSTGVVSQKLNFFSIPQGSVDPNSQTAKTLEETNLDRNGQFTYDYVITAIRTHLYVLPKSRQNTTGAVNTSTTFTVGGVSGGASGTGSLGAPAGTMNFLEQLSGRGNLIVNFGQKRYFEINQPFKKAPIGAGVTVKSYGGGSLSAVGTATNYWYSQSADTRDRYLVTPPLFVERDSIIDASIQFLDTDYSTTNYTLPNLNGTSGSFAFVNVGLCFDGFAIVPTQ